jgi:hypothetical protein
LPDGHAYRASSSESGAATATIATHSPAIHMRPRALPVDQLEQFGRSILGLQLCLGSCEVLEPDDRRAVERALGILVAQWFVESASIFVAAPPDDTGAGRPGTRKPDSDLVTDFKFGAAFDSHAGAGNIVDPAVLRFAAIAVAAQRTRLVGMAPLSAGFLMHVHQAILMPSA